GKDHTRWIDHVGQFERIVNQLPHSSTSLTPHQVQFGEEPENFIKEAIQFPPDTEMVNHQQV
ncbi:hypothetical protein, partial [Pantoea dispersa]